MQHLKQLCNLGTGTTHDDYTCISMYMCLCVTSQIPLALAKLFQFVMTSPASFRCYQKIKKELTNNCITLTTRFTRKKSVFSTYKDKPMFF